MEHRIVVIGYGNLLRCDDGVGQYIATQMMQRNKVSIKAVVDAIALHQLTPELVETLATVDLAIFVDAYLAHSELDEVRVESVAIAPAGLATGHWCEPSVLLAMTQALHHYAPNAYWVTVPGVNFEFGEHLSLVAHRGITAAIHQIERLIESFIQSALEPTLQSTLQSTLQPTIQPTRTQPCMKSG
ncbi:hydrogenase maturation protease [Leptolyngbya sp. AN02str]|uniref:hydrogenase maturation protease n=1 Tax=Leptolyngbya sp. AN02str TaxID=3423363 RepID=UPI003D315CC1